MGQKAKLWYLMKKAKRSFSTISSTMKHRARNTLRERGLSVTLRVMSAGAKNWAQLCAFPKTASSERGNVELREGIDTVI